MLTRHLPLLATLASLGAALMGGLLFTFSNFVMRALSQLPPASGMQAMQRINVTILNPLFFLIFLGTPLLCTGVLVGTLKFGSPGHVLLALGAGLYLAGVLGVTFAFNVPLNDALAKLSTNEASVHWPPYVATWLRWNHVRTVAAIGAAALMLFGGRHQGG